MTKTAPQRADQRQEAILTALAKLEMELRDAAYHWHERCYEERRAQKPTSAAYYMGIADGYRACAHRVGELYKTAVMVGGDPAVR